MNFNKFFEKLAWAAITIIAYYAADQIREMSKSIIQLNANIAILVERVGNQNDRIERMDQRLQSLERLRR